jgi:hypothetical protein
MKGSRAVIVPAILLMLLSVYFPCQVQGGANPIPMMSMSLYPSGVIASPNDFAPGAVAVGGTLTIDKMPAERIAVQVSAYIDTGWAVQCSPSVLVFANNKVTGFTAMVVVPAGTSSSQVGTLRVEAKGQGMGFVTHAVAQAIVQVAPYYKLYLDSPMAYKEIAPGSKTDFTLQILNMGNSIDTFDLVVLNYGDLAAKGWTVSFSSSSVWKVGAMQSKFVKVFVQAPMGFSKWSAYKAEGTVIMMQAVSQNSRDTGIVKEQTFPLIAYERGTYIPGFDGSMMAMTLLVVVGIALIKRRRE